MNCFQEIQSQLTSKPLLEEPFGEKGRKDGRPVGLL